MSFGSKKENTLSVAFYNVENLFDTLDAPETRDEEFTPSAILKHNTSKYIQKRSNIIRVLEHLNADIIGLCEVENRFVIEDLVSNSSLLSKKDMRVIHFESPDFRGIDNALLYDPAVYQELTSFPVAVDLEGKSTTRDILISIGVINKDTFCFYVNHWPSRSGGEAKSQPKRFAAAKVLRTSYDSLRAEFPSAFHVLMGDLNDHPTNESVEIVLGAKRAQSELLNLMYDEHLSGKGSHNYQSKWGVLDHIIISENLQARHDTDFIVKESWMLYYSEPAKDSLPSRYYGRKQCFGGYSDHLPVKAIFKH